MAGEARLAARSGYYVGEVGPDDFVSGLTRLAVRSGYCAGEAGIGAVQPRSGG